MTNRCTLVLAISLGILVTCSWQMAIAQPFRADCPTLKEAMLSPQRSERIRARIHQKYKPKGEDGAYNLVMMGRYGMAGWYNKAAGTITPMAILVDGDRVESHMLNPYSINRLLKLGYPRRTAECLQQLFNEAGI